jgi:hypothetical protein
MIGESLPRSNEPSDGYFGHFYRFVQLDKDAGWFNIDAHKPAEKDDLEQIKIPPNLQPNLKMLTYYFDVHKHRLYFVSRDSSASLSPGQVERLLKSLAERPSLVQRFGAIEIQIATEVETVTSLLTWPVLRNMCITLERPNPTDFEDEEAVFRRLQEMGARREVREYSKADEAKTLTPNGEMRSMAAVAADNGRVHVNGIDGNGVSRSADSQDYPWKKKRYYQPQIESQTDSFLGFVRELFMRRKL